MVFLSGKAATPATGAPLLPDHIDWRSSKTFLHAPTFHQDVEGFVMAGGWSVFGVGKAGTPVKGVNVVVEEINDSDGSQPTPITTPALTDAMGHFKLDVQDTTVNLAIQSRALRIVVQDTSGQPLHREVYTIKRPRRYGWGQAGAKAGAQAKTAGKWLTAPVWGPLYVLWLLLVGLWSGVRKAWHGFVGWLASMDAPTFFRRLGYVLVILAAVLAQLAPWWVWPHVLWAGIACIVFSWPLKWAQGKNKPLS